MNPQNTNTPVPVSHAVPIKPLLPISTIIGKAWKSYESFFKKLWPLSLLTVGVGILAVIALEAGLFATVLFGQKYGLSSFSSALISLLAFALIYIVIIFLMAVFFRGTADLYKGDYRGVGTAYSRGFKIFWPFAVVCIAFGLVCNAGTYLLLIPGIAFFIYLLFSSFEFIVDGKRGFDALLGSWALVKNRWWMIFGRLLLLSLLIGLVVMAGEFVFVILSVIFSVLATLLHLEFVLIAVGILCVIAVIGAIVMLVYPLLLLVHFELYFNLKETKIALNEAEANKNKKRKIALVIFSIIGILVVTIMPVFWSYQLQNFQTSLNSDSNIYQQARDQQLQELVNAQQMTTSANSIDQSFSALPVIDGIYPTIAEIGSPVAVTGQNFSPLGTSSTSDLTFVRLTNGSYTAILWSGVFSNMNSENGIRFDLPAKTCAIAIAPNSTCPADEQSTLVPGNYKVVVDVGGRGSSNSVDLDVEKY
jgi:hypothetical protein